MPDSLKILIVEDSLMDAEMLLHELGKAGFDLTSKRVDTETDYLGELAPDLDLILSDYSMPQFSGARALELALKSGLDIPFIVVSGTIGEDKAVEIVRSGATDYVLKDRLIRLAPVVRRALQEARERAGKNRTEEELRWRTALFEAQVDSGLDGMLVVDGHGRKILQNRRMAEIWKIPPEIADDLDDAKQVQFVTSRVKHPVQFAGKVAHLYGHPNEVSREEIELIDGTILDRFSAPVVGKDGRYYGRIWTFRDVTPHKQIEAQLRQAQKMEAIGQLAGGIAHDFNNMLLVIRGNAAMLLDPEVNTEEHADFGREIVKAADRAADLTRQLLLFSRKEVMQPAHLDPNEIVANLARMLQRIVGEDVRLHQNLTANPPLIFADAGMMEQVLMNLVVNARDAMPNGGNLTISTSLKTITEDARGEYPDAVPGNYVCLAVRDEGCGIAPENLARIFEPFFTTKEAGKGTGLGLATVYGIAKQHFGWIRVDSELHRGTTFYFYVPVAPGGAEKRKAVAASSKMIQGTETILVVEDEITLRLLVGNLLQRCGYSVYPASTGVEALSVWAEHRDKIHLLFTDMVMPDGMTGRELGAKLKSDRPDLRIIYTSGYSTDIMGKDLSWMEGADFLPKPYAPQKLAQTVRDALDRK